MSKNQPFSVVERRGRFVAFDFEGKRLGAFATRAAAERRVETNRQVYETVTKRAGLATPSTDRAQQQLADPESATAGRAGTGATPAQQSLFGPAQLAKAATKPVDKPAQPEAGEPPLTARQMKRLLAGQKPKGRPGKTRAPSTTAPSKPPIARSPGPTIRTVRPLAHLAPKKRRAGRSTQPTKPRRPKATQTASLPSSEGRGGHVLEDASTSLTAHDLTRMLGQAPANPAMAAQKGVGGRGSGVREETAVASGQSPASSTPPVQRPLRVRAAPPPRPVKQPRQPAGGAAPAQPAQPGNPIVDRPGRVFTQPRRHENVADTIANLRHATRRTQRQPPPIQNPAALTQPSAAGQQPHAQPGQQRQAKPQPGGLTAVLKNLVSVLSSLVKSLSGQKPGQPNQTAAGKRGKGQTATGGGPTAAAQPAKRGGLGATVANLFGRKQQQPHVGAGSAPAGVKSGIGGALGKVAGGAAMAAGGVGLVVGGLAKLGQELVKAPLEIEAFTSGLLEGQQDLRQFNAGIANSFAMLERQKLILSGRTASGTSGTTKALAESQGDLRESLQPLQALGRNLTNITGTGLNKAANFLAQIAKSALFIESINSYIASWMRDEDENQVPHAAQFIDRIAQGNWGGPKNQQP